MELLIKSLLGFALGILIFKLSLRDILKNREAQSWPSATGKIVKHYSKNSILMPASIPREISEKSATVESSKGKAKLWLEYEYMINQKTFTNDKYSFGHDGGMSGAQIEKLIKKYPLGKEIKVFYNPKNPAESILCLSARMNYFLLGLGLLLVIGGGYVLVGEILRLF
jgi:hypothetical protein